MRWPWQKRCIIVFWCFGSVRFVEDGENQGKPFVFPSRSAARDHIGWAPVLQNTPVAIMDLIDGLELTE